MIQSKIIAIRDNESMYIISSDGGKTGQLVNFASKAISPQMPVQSLIVGGYWEKYTGDKTVESLMKEYRNLK